MINLGGTMCNKTYIFSTVHLILHLRYRDSFLFEILNCKIICIKIRVTSFWNYGKLQTSMENLCQ